MMFRALSGAWTQSPNGQWAYSPYLPGNDDPNQPPPNAGQAVRGPSYYSPLCPGVALDTWILPDGQQTVDWSKCGTQSPYPPTSPQPSYPSTPVVSAPDLPVITPGGPPIQPSTAPPDFLGGLGSIGIIAAIAVVGLLLLKR